MQLFIIRYLTYDGTEKQYAAFGPNIESVVRKIKNCREVVQ